MLVQAMFVELKQNYGDSLVRVILWTAEVKLNSTYLQLNSWIAGKIHYCSWVIIEEVDPIAYSELVLIIYYVCTK